MKFRDLHRNIKFRIAEGFINSMLANMLFPFMVIYFSQHFGSALTGVLLLVNVVLSMVFNMVGGYISDQYGRKKIMIIGQVLFCASFFIMTVANSPWFESPVLTFLMTTVNGICWGIMGPASQAMLIDVTTTENRKYVFGLNYWLFNISFSVAGFVGGFLFQSYRFELLFGLTISALITLFFLIFYIDETYFPSEEVRNHQKGIFRGLGTTYLSVFRDKTFMVFALGATLLASLEVQARNYIGVRLSDEFGVQSFLGLDLDGVQMYGFLTSENSILVVLLGLFLIKILNKFSEKSTLTFGVLISCLGFACVAVFNSPWLLILSMAFATIGEVIWVPVVQSLNAELPGDDNRSSYMAVMGLSYNVKMAIGSLAVTLGAFCASPVMGAIFSFTGLVSLALLLRILLQTQQAKSCTEQVVA